MPKVPKAATNATDTPQFQQVPFVEKTITMQGTAIVRTGTVRVPVPAGTWDIVSVYIQTSTAPTGSSLIGDIKLSGTTIFAGGTGRPTVAASATQGSTISQSTTTCSGNDYFTGDIAQIGSTLPGDDPVMVISLRRKT